MLHRDDPPVSVDQLREIVERQTALLEEILRQQN